MSQQPHRPESQFTAPRASSSGDSVDLSHEAPNNETLDYEDILNNVATIEETSIAETRSLTSFIKAVLPCQNKSDRAAFHEVLELYRAEVCASIAGKIGLTSDVVLRMVLSLGLENITRFAAQTSRPYCGFSAADFSPDDAAKCRKHLDSCRLKKLGCLTVAYERTPYIQGTKDMSQRLEEQFPIIREVTNVYRIVKDLRDRPYIVNTDYLRVAHEFHAQRIAGGISVAQRIGISPAYWCPYLENILFDRGLLESYGCKLSTPIKNWQPRHLNQNLDIQDLMKLANDYLNGSEARSDDLWGAISHILHDQDGPQLFPVLKRYALRPPPRQEYPEDTPGYFTSQQSMVRWVKETIQA